MKPQNCPKNYRNVRTSFVVEFGLHLGNHWNFCCVPGVGQHRPGPQHNRPGGSVMVLSVTSSWCSGEEAGLGGGAAAEREGRAAGHRPHSGAIQ